MAESGRSFYNVIIHNAAINMITIYFDGLCYPKNPGGVAAYGYLVYRDGEPIWRGFGGVGEGRGMTNNVAEYEALMAAAQWLVDEGIEDKILIKGDSELVIKQMKGQYKVSFTRSNYLLLFSYSHKLRHMVCPFYALFYSLTQ